MLISRHKSNLHSAKVEALIVAGDGDFHQLDPSHDPICPKYPLDEQDLHHWLCNHKTTSVWEPPRVLRVACHSTWGCGGVCKEDLGQP